MPRYHSPGFEPIELVVFATTSTYTMAITDQIVEFNLKNPAPISVTGPSSLMTVGKIYTIKDGAGNAATYNITFTPNSGTGTIDGATNYVINTNNGSLSFYFDGVNLKIVNSSSGGGGGGGITSINGNTTAAQVIAAGSGITVSSSGGTTTIGTPARLGTVGTPFGSTTGQVSGYVVVPYAGTISAYDITVNAGTATIQTWKIATGTAAPTSANSISTAGVSISSGTAIRSTNLSDFTTTAVAAGDIFSWNVSASSGVTFGTFQLEITKS